ncbi:LysE/ArgO family amino acid transporter [Aliikangiella coralliicola]|uniref:Amino acid transporter n=1 Tax=Aliikangiella coralliicola TaxID=2592383 RepID=A0A545UC77_9GAMM|nr:LysE/ArgO family amino acid transporter [Aliikangiella coralliicola]TQV87033.1 amino acid transporter [Aliikangiella coralliicola]
MTIYPAIQGFFLGASMIIPIGAQNAFVLNQGIKRNYHLVAATICMLCDFGLILIGVYGGGKLLASNDFLLTLITWAGILFLVVYGGLSFKNIFKPQMVDSTVTTTKKSLKMVILATLAVTLLNPHVYLDTVVILGSVGGQFKGDAQLIFVLGCLLASLVWFYSLSIAAAKLSLTLSKPKTRKFIDFTVGLIMWTIALGLLLNWTNNLS